MKKAAKKAAPKRKAARKTEEENCEKEDAVSFRYN